MSKPEEGQQKLSMFGKLFVSTIVLGALGVVGEMTYGAYKTKELIAPILLSKSDLPSKFVFNKFEYNANPFNSKGYVEISQIDVCSGIDRQVGTLNFDITHIPFMPDRIEVSLKASPAMEKNLKYAGFDPVRTDKKPFSMVGTLDPKDGVDLSYETVDLEWVDIDSGESYKFEPLLGSFTWKDGVSTLKGEVPNIKYVGANDYFEIEKSNFELNLDPKADEEFLFSASVSKIKSRDVFIRDGSFSYATVIDAKLMNGVGNLRMGLASRKGSPIENFHLEVNTRVGDYQNLQNLSSLYEKTCGGSIMDEEQRVDMRLFTSHVVNSGIDFQLNDIGWEGPRGVVTGNARLQVNRHINPASGLPDFHSGLKMSVKMDMDPLYSAAPEFKPFYDRGVLQKKDGRLKADFEYKEKSAYVNGEYVGKNDSASIYQASLNGIFSHLGPKIQDALNLTMNSQ